MKEIWRPVPVKGFGEIYQVSNGGRVRRATNGLRDEAGFVLTPGGGRYSNVSLSKNGYQISHNIHKLVIRAFMGPPPRGHVVNHMDGDHRNNSLSNLEYVTPKENVKHSITLDLRNTPKGERHYSTRLTDKDVIEIRILYDKGKRNKDIANRFNVLRCTISEIVKRKNWKHVK